MDIRKYNREAWDSLVQDNNRWTVPVSPEQIAFARQGEWHIVLTPDKSIPRAWFGELKGAEVLCLASGGGQQGPILAAAGADVTVFDNSPAQLEQDRAVAEREDLNITTVEGDMRDLRVFADEAFDLIVHPCSNGFIPDVNPVWQESFRVLRPGGRLMSGFINPLFFLFDYWEMEKGNLEVRYRLPYSDQDQLSEERLAKLKEAGEPLEFGHTLEDQIGGQLRAGFQLIGFYEDVWSDEPAKLLSEHISGFIATLAEKPNQGETS